MLTNALHGTANFSADSKELAQIPARNLHYTVIQTRLKIGCSGIGH